jgi:alkaline phosphatase
VKLALVLPLSACALGALGCASAGASEEKNAAPAASTNSWYEDGQAALAARKAQNSNKKHAKNVILFIGDGMDPTTVAAARIFDGQSRGEDGEENLLSFEKFPYVAYSKTYTTDYQVADSAGTASAMLTGVKTRSGVLSISADAPRGDCAAALASAVPTLAELAEQRGLATGVVSTARVTHATPGAVYAHSADRGWEADNHMPDAAKAAGCKDIARQLIEFPYGDGLEVVLGGGRRIFTPSTANDPETGKAGARKDGRDLTAEWTQKSPQHQYVWNSDGFNAAPSSSKLLGLFEPSHLKLEMERAEDEAGAPSLTHMTQKAIEVLSRNEDGYFLMVEAGRIDHAHHAGIARGALTETQEYAKAVARARAMTSEKDTLIIVTADHGHTLAFQGYPAKGNDILGLAAVKNDDGEYEPMKAAGDKKPYTTLVYANGLGSVFANGVDLSDGRPVPTQDELGKPRYRQQALIPTGGETHGGQDVPVYASGPKAYLISGVFEQNYIFHVIADALELGE